MSAREKKAQIVAEIKEKLAESSSAILVDYRGLTVEEVTELRREFRNNGVDYKVYKNTLTELAAKDLGLDELIPYLKGPTAIAFGIKDPVAPAKILTEHMKKLKKMEFKVGVVDGKVIDVDGFAWLITLREGAHCKTWQHNAPIRLVHVLSTLPCYALNAVKKPRSLINCDN